MFIPIHPINPDPRKIRQVVDCLKKGGIIVYPTDTVYSFGCDIENSKGMELIARLQGKKSGTSKFSIICHDLGHLSEYCQPLDNQVFRLMKRSLPGPYTFILKANNNVPRIFKSKKKTIGIRMPDNKIARDIVRELGRPIVTSSIHDEDKIIEYTTDPELIYERLGNQVDLVVAGGFGGIEASTVFDCTSNEVLLVREGKGSLEVMD